MFVIAFAFVFPPIDDVLDVDVDVDVNVDADVLDVVLNANAADALFRKRASVISSIRSQSKVHKGYQYQLQYIIKDYFC